jgi:anion transporter
MSVKSKLIRWVICLLPLLLLLVPTTEAFTPMIRLFIAETLTMILCLCLGQIDMMIVTFAIPFVYYMSGILEMTDALSSYAGSIIWIGVGCFILVNILQRIGLMSRIAYWIIYHTGGTYRGFCFGMLLVGIVLNIVAPAPQVATVMFFLCASICKEFGYKTGKTSAGIMFASVIACNTTQLFLYMPTQQGVALGIVGVEMTWINYLIQNAIFIPVVVLLCFLITIILPKDEDFNGKEYFKMKLAEMGPVSLQEKITAVILVLFVAFLLTTTYTGFPIVYGFICVPIVLFIAGVGKGEDIVKVNFGVLLMIGGCMCIGSAASAAGAGVWIANCLMPILNGMSKYLFIFFSYVFGVVMNFLMTPMAAMSSLSQPLADIASTLGVSSKVTMLSFCAGLEQWILPYEVGSLVTMFSLGYVSMKDFMKFGLVKTVVVTICMLALVIPYWLLLGV